LRLVRQANTDMIHRNAATGRGIRLYPPSSQRPFATPERGCIRQEDR
jgi:hypothetical protein